VNCRQPSLPEDPDLTVVSGLGTLDTAPAELSGDRDIAPAPPRVGAASEKRRHPAPSEADDFSTLLWAEFAGEAKVPRAEGWFCTPDWGCPPPGVAPEPKRRQFWLSMDRPSVKVFPLADA
jgi:hypothetical protein